jgi:hypothetical protein
MFITDIKKKGKEITRKNKSYNSKLKRKKYKNLENNLLGLIFVKELEVRKYFHKFLCAWITNIKILVGFHSENAIFSIVS